MARVSLRRLTLFNFRSFMGLHVIRFVEGGLVILRGRNRDTGGGSGAGKSNILLAIAFIFGYCRHSASALQCWLDDTPFYVEVELDVDGESVVVKRGAKGLTIGKLKGRAAEEKLDELCGVAPELREALTYRDQVKPLRFLSMKDKEMKEFLFGVLGLGNLEEEIERRTKVLGELERQATADQNALKVWEESSRDRLKEPVKPTLDADEHTQYKLADDIEQQAEMLRDEVYQAEQELASIPEPDQSEVERLRKGVTEANRHIETLDAIDKAALRAWEEELKVLRRVLQFREEQVHILAAYKSQIKAHQAIAAKLEQDKCAMCDRQWDAAREELEDTKGEIVELARKATVCQEEVDLIPEAREAVRRKIEVDKFKPNPLLAQLKTVRENLMVKLAEAIQSVKSAKQVAEAQARERLAKVRQTLAECERERDAHLHAAKAIGLVNHQRLQDYENAKLAHLNAIARKALYEGEAAKSRAEYECEADYLDLLKGFRNRIFDEVLMSIGSEASNIIATLPNAQHISIEFRSERQTGKGTIQERITPVVTLHGVERVLEESVSGGQLTSIGLAVDLAVVRVISARLGCNLNWIILDESFNGHDTITKAGCLEMLQTYAQDKLVVIVDHESEFQEMFSGVVTVDHYQRVSSVA